MLALSKKEGFSRVAPEWSGFGADITFAHWCRETQYPTSPVRHASPLVLSRLRAPLDLVDFTPVNCGVIPYHVHRMLLSDDTDVVGVRAAPATRADPVPRWYVKLRTTIPPSDPSEPPSPANPFPGWPSRQRVFVGSFPTVCAAAAASFEWRIRDICASVRYHPSDHVRRRIVQRLERWQSNMTTCTQSLTPDTLPANLRLAIRLT
jgi:hypothetical protein